MKRGFDIGDTVLCTESGVVGVVLNFYYPTSCDEQTMVMTDDGRKYHAPTSWWVKYDEGSRKDVSGVHLLPKILMNDTREAMTNYRNTDVITLNVNIPKDLLDDIQRVLINNVEFIKRGNNKL